MASLSSRLREILTEKLVFFVEITSSWVVDAIFLFIWVAIHYLRKYIIAKYGTESTELSFKIVLYAMEYAALTCTVAFFAGDVIRTFIKIYYWIKQAIVRDKKHGKKGNPRT